MTRSLTVPQLTEDVAARAAVEIILERRDKWQLAMDAMLGVRAAQEQCSKAGIVPFRGLRDAYFEVTGNDSLRLSGSDGQQSWSGRLWRTREGVTTTNLPNLLMNALNKRLIQDYENIGWAGLDRIVRFVGVRDFKTNRSVRLGYFPDLPTVDEGAAYAEAANPTDELISYNILKKGNVWTLTEETLRNDDLRGLRLIPARLARAGIRTAKKFVTSLLTTPGNYEPDGVAVFAAAHNNLGSLALSAAELDAREALLFAQTEPNSSEKLGFRLHWIVIPLALDSTARKINNDLSATNNWAGRFGSGPFPPGIIVDELLADANDWYYGTDDGPFIEMAVLDGMDGRPPIPTILLANEPTVGKRFTSGEAVYKVKLAFGGDYVDFRTAGKNVVP